MKLSKNKLNRIRNTKNQTKKKRKKNRKKNRKKKVKRRSRRRRLNLKKRTLKKNKRGGAFALPEWARLPPWPWKRGKRSVVDRRDQAIKNHKIFIENLKKEIKEDEKTLRQWKEKAKDSSKGKAYFRRAKIQEKRFEKVLENDNNALLLMEKQVEALKRSKTNEKIVLLMSETSEILKSTNEKSLNDIAGLGSPTGETRSRLDNAKKIVKKVHKSIKDKPLDASALRKLENTYVTYQIITPLNDVDNPGQIIFDKNRQPVKDKNGEVVRLKSIDVRFIRLPPPGTARKAVLLAKRVAKWKSVPLATAVPLTETTEATVPPEDGMSTNAEVVSIDSIDTPIEPKIENRKKFDKLLGKSYDKTLTELRDKTNKNPADTQFVIELKDWQKRMEIFKKKNTPIASKTHAAKIVDQKKLDIKTLESEIKKCNEEAFNMTGKSQDTKKKECNKIRGTLNSVKIR